MPWGELIPTLVPCKNLKGFFLTTFKHCWHIYLWSKVVCFFCFVLVPMRSTKPRCFRSHSWSLWKALEEGCISLVSWCSDMLRCRSSWILNDLSGSLFCKYEIHWTFRCFFRSCSWCFWKAFDEDGCMCFDSMTFGLAVQKFLNIE